MARHYNPSIGDRINRIFRFKAGDAIDNDVEGLYAVVPVTPVCRIVRSVSSQSTGNMSAYTTPTDKDFYLTAIQASFAKDATCDVASGPGRVSVVIDGATQYILEFALLTLTAQSDAVVIVFPYPVKIDRTSSIAWTNTFTAGAMARTLTLVGYTEEATAT